MCAMVPRWRLFGDFWFLHFQQAARSTSQTSILNLHWKCGPMPNVMAALPNIDGALGSTPQFG